MPGEERDWGGACRGQTGGQEAGEEAGAMVQEGVRPELYLQIWGWRGESMAELGGRWNGAGAWQAVGRIGRRHEESTHRSSPQ